MSLGPHLFGVACPHPDLTCRYSAAAGVCKRFGRAPPPADPATLERFGEFVRSWLEKNLTPLEPSTDVSFETWLLKTPYTATRKAELALTYYQMGSKWERKIRACKSFIKDECYPDWKYQRGINSRTDSMKCLLGPWFKVIEEVLFKLPYFIKKIPIADRPNYIKERLTRLGVRYLASDYTSFEALFTADLMRNCEFQLYKYMTKFVPGHKDFWKLLDEVLAGENVCQYKWFQVRIRATRMSGEMCTSLGNGFSNLMFILFLCSELGSEVDGVVEGDDGLFAIKGPIPTTEHFEKLGLRIKLEIHEELSEASFCGLIFDEYDTINVTDPLAELATFGWGTAKYLNAKQSKLLSLLRCKGLSLVHQYPGCPILQELGLYAIRMTRGIDARTYANSRHVCEWEREQILAALKDEKKLNEKVREPPKNTRLLIEKKFGMTIEQQLKIEALLRDKHDLSPIRLPFSVEVPQQWLDYSRDYTTLTDPRTIDDTTFDCPESQTRRNSWKEVLRQPKAKKLG